MAVQVRAIYNPGRVIFRPYSDDEQLLKITAMGNILCIDGPPWLLLFDFNTPSRGLWRR